MSYYTDAYIEHQIEAVKRVRELHKPVRSYGQDICAGCSEIATLAAKHEVSVAYLFCPTIRALNGDF